MTIDQAAVLAELEVLVARYEQALVHNDLDTLAELFWHDPRTVRFGATENLYGYEAIEQFRRGRATQGLARVVRHQTLTTFGDHTAVSMIEYQRPGDAMPGRQSQTWVRLPEGWRVVAAHVSVMQPPR